MFHPAAMNFTINNFFGPTFHGPAWNFVPHIPMFDPIMLTQPRRQNVQNQGTAINERSHLEEEERQLEEKKRAVAAKRKKLARETQEIGQRRREMAKEWEKLAYQREEIDNERRAMMHEKNETRTKRKELASESKKIAKERAQFKLERMKMAREREEFVVERAEMARKRTAGSIKFFDQQHDSKRTKVVESGEVQVVNKSPPTSIMYNQVVNNYTFNISAAPVKIRPIASKRQAAIKANKKLAMITEN